ncbi:hypothetical protein Tco_0633580 [Tanacetum coccineum]
MLNSLRNVSLRQEIMRRAVDLGRNSRKKEDTNTSDKSLESFLKRWRVLNHNKRIGFRFVVSGKARIELQTAYCPKCRGGRDRGSDNWIVNNALHMG